MGAILNVQVNDVLEFRLDDDSHVRVTFPESSLMGPSLGSLKKTAARLGAAEGDCMTLVFDSANMTVKTDLCVKADCRTDWETIGRLTGLGSTADLRALAGTLRCSEAEVRGFLHCRGDDRILEFLPCA